MPPTVNWADLFERAAAFEVTEADVTAALGRRRYAGQRAGDEDEASDETGEGPDG